MFDSEQMRWYCAAYSCVMTHQRKHIALEYINIHWRAATFTSVGYIVYCDNPLLEHSCT